MAPTHDLVLEEPRAHARKVLVDLAEQSIDRLECRRADRCERDDARRVRRRQRRVELLERAAVPGDGWVECRLSCEKLAVRIERDLALPERCAPTELDEDLDEE